MKQKATRATRRIEDGLVGAGADDAHAQLDDVARGKKLTLVTFAGARDQELKQRIQHRQRLVGDAVGRQLAHADGQVLGGQQRSRPWFQHARPGGFRFIQQLAHDVLDGAGCQWSLGRVRAQTLRLAASLVAELGD